MVNILPERCSHEWNEFKEDISVSSLPNHMGINLHDSILYLSCRVH